MPVFSSQPYLLTKWPKIYLNWLKKNQQGAELKQIIFFSNDHIALDFYYLKAGKTQQQREWMGSAWF